VRSQKIAKYVLVLLACVYLSGYSYLFCPGESVISSIGVDGTGYKQYKTGPGLTTFTRVEHILLWVTVDKGKAGRIGPNTALNHT